MQEYLVEVKNIFEAIDPADAVRQMVEWLYEAAGSTMYRVVDFHQGTDFFIDAEDTYGYG